MVKKRAPVRRAASDRSDSGDNAEFKREMEIMREVMERRKEALRQLAVTASIMEEDRDILRDLAKK
jgi:hypothetical protein